jgi:diacylglycerol kinase family enzyme
LDRRRQIRRLPVLVNARSGAGAGPTSAERIAGLFRAAGAEADVRVPSSGEALAHTARELARARPGAIVAAGGDGTVNTVAAVLAGGDTALGIIPLGTFNHFARDAGIPLDETAAIVTVLEGRRRRVDVGEVNGRVFVNNSSIGLYPAMVRRRTKEERLGRGRWHATLWAAQAVLRTHSFMHVTLEVEGRAHRRRTPLVFVGNNVYQMSGLDIGRRSRLDAGVLSVYVTHAGGRLGLARLALHALSGRLEQARDFEAAAVAELRIESRHKRLLVATDGEVAPVDTPLVYRIRARALDILAP